MNERFISILWINFINFSSFSFVFQLKWSFNWIAGFESKTMNFSFLFILLFFGLFLCFLLNSLLLFFICYETLIVLLFFILFLYIPSYYRIRTALFFFVFSIFGSISFIVCLLIFISSCWLISSLLIIVPFFIKIPSFPFFYWLPEVHCEVDSSIINSMNHSRNRIIT